MTTLVTTIAATYLTTMATTMATTARFRSTAATCANDFLQPLV